VVVVVVVVVVCRSWWRMPRTARALIVILGLSQALPAAPESSRSSQMAPPAVDCSKARLPRESAHLTAQLPLTSWKQPAMKLVWSSWELPGLPWEHAARRTPNLLRTNACCNSDRARSRRAGRVLGGMVSLCHCGNGPRPDRPIRAAVCKTRDAR
jgi:hypothetical protein